MRAIDRARAGAELLDEIVPGWVNVVNPDKIQMEGCNFLGKGPECGCVVEQIEQRQFDGNIIIPYIEDMSLGKDNGFVAVGTENREYMQDYKNLTRAWRKIIRERQANG